MSTVIIGALIVVGLLAIVGAIFLMRQSGNREELGGGAPVASSPAPSSEEATSVSPDKPTAQIEDNAEQEQQSEYTSPLSQDGEQHIVLNGQFHELVDQLRLLHTQSQEMEQRMNALNEMVERIGQH